MDPKLHRHIIDRKLIDQSIHRHLQFFLSSHKRGCLETNNEVEGLKIKEGVLALVLT